MEIQKISENAEYLKEAQVLKFKSSIIANRKANINFEFKTDKVVVDVTATCGCTVPYFEKIDEGLYRVEVSFKPAGIGLNRKTMYIKFKEGQGDTEHLRLILEANAI